MTIIYSTGIQQTVSDLQLEHNIVRLDFNERKEWGLAPPSELATLWQLRWINPGVSSLPPLSWITSPYHMNCFLVNETSNKRIFKIDIERANLTLLSDDSDFQGVQCFVSSWRLDR